MQAALAVRIIISMCRCIKQITHTPVRTQSLLEAEISNCLARAQVHRVRYGHLTGCFFIHHSHHLQPWSHHTSLSQSIRFLVQMHPKAPRVSRTHLNKTTDRVRYGIQIQIIIKTVPKRREA